MSLDEHLFLIIRHNRFSIRLVSQRPLTAEDRVDFQYGSCEICRGEIDTGTVFFRSISVFATGWTVVGSNPGGRRKIFCTRPDRPWESATLLYNGYQISYPSLTIHPIGRYS